MWKRFSNRDTLADCFATQFDNQSSMVDGAYYRHVMLSELAKARVQRIFIARPIKKWIGDMPKSWIALEDMKTETNFNGSYQGERDKILLINKLVKNRKLADGYQMFEIETQESFFDYVFEDMTVFDRARESGRAAL